MRRFGKRSRAPLTPPSSLLPTHQPTPSPHLPFNRTEADKEKFLDEVKHKGLADLEALADELGTKSEQELDFFLALLHEHLGRQYLQALINAQPAHQSIAKQNALMAKLLERVMNGSFEGHMQRLLTNVTATDPDALFAGGGGAETGKMGGVGRRRVAAPVPKKGYTKRKREEQAKEEAVRKREEQVKEEAAKKRAKNKKTTVEAVEEEEKKEEGENEEENSQEQPKPDALARAPATAEQEEDQVVGGVEEEEEEEEEEGVYEENADDWEPVAAVAAVGPMEEMKQKVEEEGRKVE